MKNWLKSAEYIANRSLNSCVRLFRLQNAYQSVHFSEKINRLLTRKKNLTVLQALPVKEKLWKSNLVSIFSRFEKSYSPTFSQGSIFNKQKINRTISRKKKTWFWPQNLFFSGEFEEKSQSSNLRWSEFCLLEKLDWKRITWVVWRIKKTCFDSKKRICERRKNIRRI